MKKMSPKGQRWLKMFHVVFAGFWMSSGVSLLLLNLFVAPEQGAAIYGANLAMKFIDDFVIIPAANLCLLTGLIYGIWTRWGFFQHHWVTVKWVITVTGITVGTIWLGPWLNSMTALAGEAGAAALQDPGYQHARAMNLGVGAAVAGSLVFATAISVLKPWGRRRR